jgi:hypothetical protein
VSHCAARVRASCLGFSAQPKARALCGLERTRARARAPARARTVVPNAARTSDRLRARPGASGALSLPAQRPGCASAACVRATTPHGSRCAAQRVTRLLAGARAGSCAHATRQPTGATPRSARSSIGAARARPRRITPPRGRRRERALRWRPEPRVRACRGVPRFFYAPATAAQRRERCDGVASDAK